MKIEQLQKRIKRIMPNLEIDKIEVNQEGLANDVVIVNHEFVFRFAKDENFAKVLRKEIKILNSIQSKIEIEIPNPIYHDQESLVYPYLNGKPLLRDTLISLGQKTQRNLSRQLGAFLQQLHEVEQNTVRGNIPATQARVTQEKWIEMYSKIEEKLYPLFLPHQIQWSDQLFDRVLSDPQAFDYQAVLIHGDLAPYHILYDDHEKRIIGIIDFGVSGMGDPALDIGNLITWYGESFVAKMEAAYPGLNFYLPRARFYAQAIELEWVLLGLETGESFWFTAHLGGVRDIQI